MRCRLDAAAPQQPCEMRPASIERHRTAVDHEVVVRLGREDFVVGDSVPVEVSRDLPRRLAGAPSIRHRPGGARAEDRHPVTGPFQPHDDRDGRVGRRLGQVRANRPFEIQQDSHSGIPNRNP